MRVQDATFSPDETCIMKHALKVDCAFINMVCPFWEASESQSDLASHSSWQSNR